MTFNPTPSEPLIVHSLDGFYTAVEKTMKAQGPTADLNHIDVSRIRIFDGLFEDSEFNGNISQWNTSCAQSMRSFFRGSAFNGDISKWDVANVLYMQDMFNASVFTGNLAKWNPSALQEAIGMFSKSPFSGDVSKWRLPNLSSCGCMFDENFCGQLPVVEHKKPYTS